MSTITIPTTETPDDAKVSTNEVLLQVKALKEIRKSLRKATFNMKKSSTNVDNLKDVETNKLKKDCQDDTKTEIWYRDDQPRRADTKKKYFTNFMAEVIGTALLMFLGCMGCAPQADDPPAVHHMSALSFGFVVLIIIQIFGHVSMAHLNPSVTICALMLKMLSPAMGVVYVLGQFVGATFGFALLKVLIPQEWVVPGFCATKPHAQSTPIQGLAIETIITGVLALVCCGVWDKRNAEKQDSVAAKFGFIVAALSMVAGPLTGASMNTARSFAPAVLEGDYAYQWIYWIGPNLGAILATALYMLLFSYKEEEPRNDGTELEEVNQMIT